VKLANRLFLLFSNKSLASSQQESAQKTAKTHKSLASCGLESRPKSKAAGDKKSIRDVDRFYLEIAIVNSTEMGKLKVSDPPSPYFFNRMATLEGILSKLGLMIDGNVEILVQDATRGRGKEVYHELPDHTARLCDAEKEGKLHQFSYLVVVQYPGG